MIAGFQLLGEKCDIFSVLYKGFWKFSEQYRVQKINDVCVSACMRERGEKDMEESERERGSERERKRVT